MIRSADSLHSFAKWYLVSLATIHATELQVLPTIQIKISSHRVLSVHSKMQELRRVKCHWQSIVDMVLKRHLLIRGLILKARGQVMKHP